MAGTLIDRPFSFRSFQLTISLRAPARCRAPVLALKLFGGAGPILPAFVASRRFPGPHTALLSKGPPSNGSRSAPRSRARCDRETQAHAPIWRSSRSTAGARPAGTDHRAPPAGAPHRADKPEEHP